jgi:methylamine dehydrogenase accessory protein MauD
MNPSWSADMMLALLVLQWLVLGGLVVAVLALARQVGILHTRLAPAGALVTQAGPKIGELAPVLEASDLDGRAMRIGGARPRGLFLLFVSPTCPICKALVPAAKSLARAERARLDFAFASDGSTREAHQRYAADMGLDGWPYLLSTELGMRFEVGKLPYAVLIDAAGVLRGKGLVNSREHLESLIESMDSGFATLQDYLNHDAVDVGGARNAASTTHNRS